jgi:SAM-dependent methyltransferase
VHRSDREGSPLEPACAGQSPRRGVYTHGHHGSVLRAHRWRTAVNSAGYLLPKLRVGDSILDVGCGPGTITVDLARTVGPGRVVGIDAEAAVLAEGRALAAERNLDNVEFHEARAESLPYDDGSFDVVHAHQLLQHVAAPATVLEEMGRVCKPGGIVAARDGDYHSMVWWPEDPLLDQWRAIYSAVARANGGEPDAGRRLRSWAEEAGYSRIECTASAWCFATDEERAWWGDSWAERVTDSALAERAIELGLAGRDDLAAIAAAWRAWVAARDGWFAMVHGEILCEA